MISISNNISEKPTSKVIFKTTLDKTVDYILASLETKKIYSESQSTLATNIGVSRGTVNGYYKVLREDPRFFVGKAIRRSKSKLFYTVKISLKPSLRFFLSEYRTVRKSYNMNIKFNIKTLDVRESDGSNNVGFLSKKNLKQEFITKNQQGDKRRLELKYELGVRCKLHPVNHAPLLDAYPLEALEYAAQEMNEVFQEKTNFIRHPFFFLKKVLARWAERKGIIPAWSHMYKSKQESMSQWRQKREEQQHEREEQQQERKNYEKKKEVERAEKWKNRTPEQKKLDFEISYNFVKTLGPPESVKHLLDNLMVSYGMDAEFFTKPYDESEFPVSS